MKQQLQQQWLKLSTKLDAMTLRERAMVFGAATAAILFLLYSMKIEPLLQRQKILLAQISQQQNQIGGIDSEITQKAQAFSADPDAPVRQQLSELRHEMESTSAGLLAVQKGLVAPDKITPLLEHLLRGNGRLRLVSLKTLPVAGMNDASASADSKAGKPAADESAPAAAMPATPAAAVTAIAGAAVDAAAAKQAASAGATPTAKPRELLYRHGVEIVLQGSYLDMVNYMEALEALPSQLFWGKAKLDAGQYPNSRLTLTLYTLSLDAKWMKL
jgi:MSHA biogenesis protein MshJ